MSIRPMTKDEIVRGLRRAAEVCIEKQSPDYWSIDVVQADDVFYAAYEFLEDKWSLSDSPDDIAAFLLICAEAHN